MDAAGVNYESLDEFKVLASRRAAETAKFAGKMFEEFSWSRGESAYVGRIRGSNLIVATVTEGLGTKNLVAENSALRKSSGRTYYDTIARDNVAMIANDLITSGARPWIFMLHPALAEGGHLNGQNGQDLIEGTYAALEECGMVWGPGETPELNGIIVPGTMCLSGAATGIVDSMQSLINPANIKPGQRIVLLGSSGIHSNGLSRARAIAEQLPDKYLEKMASGQMFGEALLVPTMLYARFMNACHDNYIPISYAINMTGHGWRKIMRAVQPFTYRMTEIPEPHEVFSFIMQHAGMSVEDAYKAFNMGAGFALIVDASYVNELQKIGAKLHIPVLNAGVVEAGEKRVIIEPINVTLDELSIR
jgi:phosphoribosylformylglycinamidine cyclo-ligase